MKEKPVSKQPDYWQDATEYLSAKDEVLGAIIARFPDLVMASRGNAFETLLRAIVGQQISVKAADSVWQKLTHHLGEVHQDKVLNSDTEALRGCGLSGQKAGYVQNIARHFADNNIHTHDYWQHKPYQQISDELIQIKGVGSWTVEMFAMFYLLEPDIFPIKDLGVIKAVNQAYQTDTLSEIEVLSETWKPYRSVASWYLWRSIDNEAINY